MKPSSASFLLVVFFIVCRSLQAQTSEFLHTELAWKTMETEHFLVHYHMGTERTAQEVAFIAEGIYEPVTSLYGHTPDRKVNLVIRDYDDYSNAAAYFYDNKIEIWASAMDFELRGTHRWLENVVTHEFTHLVQIQTAMKFGRTIPGIYLQWFGYEDERRPDVLYGYPNVLVSYPFSGVVVPSWFAEGTAQYNHPDLKYDYWDTHRDMILRMCMIEGNPLGWEDMGVFGKTSLGNESTYNAGFSLVQFIAERYGTDKLRDISSALGSLGRLTIDGAIQRVLGKSGEELYREWKDDRENHYRDVVNKLRPHLLEGDIIESEGFGNFYPTFTPDGQGVVYTSNKGSDTFGQSALYMVDLGSMDKKKLVEGVRSTVSFSPDGRWIYYSKATRDNPHWSRLYDIHRYDLEQEIEERLTFGLRAINPRVSSDGKKIVFAFGSGGTLNIGVCDSDGNNSRSITAFSDGEQVFTPVWSPDGKMIAAGYSTGERQKVITVDSNGGNFEVIAAGSDCRNPFFSKDGSRVYYSSDRSGIFNIYSVTTKDGTHLQETNVLGGAFAPAVNERGEIIYASYSCSGYKISLLSHPSHIPLTERAVGVGGENDATTRAGEVHARRLVGVGDSPPRVIENRTYRNVFGSLSVVPIIRVDNYNPRNQGLNVVKGGLVFTSSEVLDKLSLFGGAAFNRILERDLFLLFEYRDRLPLLSGMGIEPVLSLALYNSTRKTYNSFTLDPSPVVITPEISYNLFEVDLSAMQPVFNEYTTLELRYSLRRYSAEIGSFVNPNTLTLAPAFRSTYLIGNVLAGEIRHNDISPSVDKDINPVGRSMRLRYTYESNKFNPEGEFKAENGILVPQYQNVIFHQINFEWNEHLKLPFEKHTLSLGVRTGGILGKSVDDFFDLYAGGVVGMKGYPFYALGGNTVAVVSGAYRFPIFQKLNFRILQFYFTKLYASFFGDYGNAWTGRIPGTADWKKDLGFELRLEAFSFYMLPTRFFFSGAYGFDRFERTFSSVKVDYGKEWRFYFGMLFGFDLNDHRAHHRGWYH